MDKRQENLIVRSSQLRGGLWYDVARASNNRMISIVACCHSVKLCALATRAFRSQQCHLEQVFPAWVHRTGVPSLGA